jgi:hypothetical protein
MAAMADQDELEPRPAVPVLSYQTPGASGAMVRVGSYGNNEEAELRASALAAEGIPSRVFNGNVNSLGIPYAGFADVELHVRQEDAQRAAEVLARDAAEDDLEPQELSPADSPPTDDDGNALNLVPLVAFDSVRLMRDAQTILSSARIRSYPPTLVRRGDRPPGQGARFILSVAEDDLERARRVLEEADADAASEDENGGRCPRCRSWRVFPVSQFWKGLAAMVGMGPTPQPLMECLACKHVGTKEEFVARVSGGASASESDDATPQ